MYVPLLEAREIRVDRRQIGEEAFLQVAFYQDHNSAHGHGQFLSYSPCQISRHQIVRQITHCDRYGSIPKKNCALNVTIC